jgi:hypothetical protein
MWPKIEFDYDEPVILHLRYREGKVVDSKYYDRWPGDTTQLLFMAEEGLFYLSDTAGSLLNARLRAQGYEAGDALAIVKTKVPCVNSERPITEYVPYKLEGLED